MMWRIRRQIKHRAWPQEVYNLHKIGTWITPLQAGNQCSREVGRKRYGRRKEVLFIGVNHPVNTHSAQVMNQSVWEPRDLDLGFNLSLHPWFGSSPSPLQACSFSLLSLTQVTAHRQCKALPHSVARWHWVLIRTLASGMFSYSNPDCVNLWDSWYSYFPENMRDAHLQLQPHLAHQHWPVFFPSLQCSNPKVTFYSNIFGYVFAS